MAVVDTKRARGGGYMVEGGGDWIGCHATTIKSYLGEGYPGSYPPEERIIVVLILICSVYMQYVLYITLMEGFV